MVLKEQNRKQVYSDGDETEKRMLAVAQKYPEDLSQDYISDDSSYTINNTFSAVRQNILNWYPFKENAQILEIGAGMGAITGMLCDHAAYVTALEMNQIRADVIRARYPKRDNLEIISGNINEWQTERKYDYVVFIGVLEYAGIFSDAENPYDEFLYHAKSFLKDDGVLLFAIENRFGLKYWLGASEDHLQEPFAGLMGYQDKKGPRTFSRSELSCMLQRTGFPYCRFYSVLPDYKFPELIFADDYQPDAMNLKKVSFTYAKNSTLIGDEKLLYQELIANGTFSFFANSFLIEASMEEPVQRHVVHVSAKGEVYQEFRVSTVIFNDEYVYKIPMHQNAQVHIQNILEHTCCLQEQGIPILPYEKNGNTLRCKRYQGVSAQKIFQNALTENEKGKLEELIRCLRDCYLKSSETVPYNKNNLIQQNQLGDGHTNYGRILQKAYIDMTFYNAFYENGTLTFYDQEWCVERVPLNFCLYYSIKSAYFRAGVDTSISFGELLESAGIQKTEICAYEKLETFIWSQVLYRQTDFYGADGYCNRYDARFTLKEKQKQERRKTEELEDRLVQAYGQTDKDRMQIQKMTDQISHLLESERAFKRQTSHLLESEKACKREILEKNRNIERLSESEQHLKQELKNKQGHIELLLESEREWERLKKSRTWRAACGLQKLSMGLMPPGSVRRMSAKLFLKFARHPVQFLHKLTPDRIRHFWRFLRDEGPEFVSRRIDLSMPEADYQNALPSVNLDMEEKSFAAYPALEFPAAEHPEVSIIIPVYNQFPYTYGCLKSILEQTGNTVSYEILIADDCSTDDTIRLGELTKNLTILRNKQNLLFLKNCNHAAASARGRYLLFLNNDTQVQKNWLEPLVRLMEQDPEIGMTGSKLVYPDGRLQEAGGIIWKDGSAWNYGNRQEADRPEYNYVKEVDYISGASLMIRRDLWEEIGGFDERYAPAYCEDSDLAFEVRKRGYRVVYQPQSVVVHFEGVSNGADTGAGVKQYQIENSRKLTQKWAEALQGHYPNGEHVFRARERSQGKPVVLFIDHYVPQYDKDAGSRTVYQYMQMFVHKGFQVKFIGDNFYRHEPYTSSLEQLGIEVLYGNGYQSHIFQWLDANHKYMDFVFLNRPHISMKYIDYFYNKTDVKIIYYGHDLHFLRNQREYELTGDLAKLREAKEWKKQELYLMERAAVSYYPSCVEVEEIHKIHPELPVKAITAYVYDRWMEHIEMDFSKREGILFVGGFVHEPNLDAVRWFVHEILPRIRRNVEIPFYIVGSHAPREVLGLDGKDGICVKGYLSNDALQQLYGTCRLAVVPLRYGAGVKGKVIEAVYHGVPVVTTSVGAEGIMEAETVMEIQDEPQAFADEVVRLYKDFAKLREVSRNTQTFIKKYFSIKAVWETIAEDFVT